MWNDAHCILQWLTVSSRPLRVEELAEVFAIDFDEEMSGVPSFDPSWRDANAEMAVLSACSTLVAIVDAGRHGKIVLFSHFSVQEYLVSDRIANAGHVSHFHIHLKPAHTLLAKACLSVLCHLDSRIDKAEITNFPLVEYAAEHWVDHARFEDVASYIRDGMDLIFDKDKPHFATWVWVLDIEAQVFTIRQRFALVGGREQLKPIPLYYAALCGLGGRVERLLAAHPQDLNAEGGVWGSPLNAALAEGHLKIALFLLDRGADPENRGEEDQTALYIASSRGHTDVVRSLIDRGADLNVKCQDRHHDYEIAVTWTPLQVAIYTGHRDIAILLLEGGAATEIRIHARPDEIRGYRKVRIGSAQTALYMASSYGDTDVVRSLIHHGADVNTKCHGRIPNYQYMWTPLHVAIKEEHRDIVLLLLEGGADTETLNSKNETALYMASSLGRADIVQLLVSHGADLNTGCRASAIAYYGVKWTPLHVATSKRNTLIPRILLEYGANPNVPDAKGATALHVATQQYHEVVALVELLLEYGANVDARGEEGRTPLHEAAYQGDVRVVQLLLNHGSDPHARTDDGKTPLQLANLFHSRASKEAQEQLIPLLSEPTDEIM